jgi:hypothetical protein
MGETREVGKRCERRRGWKERREKASEVNVRDEGGGMGEGGGGRGEGGGGGWGKGETESSAWTTEFWLEWVTSDSYKLLGFPDHLKSYYFVLKVH